MLLAHSFENLTTKSQVRLFTGGFLLSMSAAADKAAADKAAAEVVELSDRELKIVDSLA